MTQQLADALDLELADLRRPSPVLSQNVLLINLLLAFFSLHQLGVVRATDDVSQRCPSHIPTFTDPGYQVRLEY